MTNDQDYDEDGNNIVPCPICLDVYCPGNQFDRNGNKIGDGKCPKEDEFARDMTTPTTPQEDRATMLANDWLEMQDETTKAIVATLLSQERTRLKEEIERLRTEVLPTHAEENGYGCALDDMSSKLTH